MAAGWCSARTHWGIACWGVAAARPVGACLYWGPYCQLTSCCCCSRLLHALSVQQHGSSISVGFEPHVLTPPCSRHPCFPAAPPPPSNRKRDGKRPAVAARKARKAGATQQQPSPSPGGVKSGGVSKPFRGRPMKGGMKGPGGGPGKGRGGKPAGGRGKRQ